MSTARQPRYVHGTQPSEQQRLGLMNRLINEPSLRELNLKGGERILDVGCGLAQFTRAMAAAAGEKGRVIGVEKDETQLAEALRQASAGTERVELRHGDATSLPLTEGEWGSFDVVHCRFVLEHVSDPLAVVGQMVAAAKPGGRVVLQDDDHELLRVWPPCPAFEELWRAYYPVYDRLGGDPLVGRKLVSILHDAGATPSRNTWIFYGGCAGHPDFNGLLDNLCGVLEGARDHVIAHGTDKVVFDKGMHAVDEWKRRPDAALWYAMNWAEGVRTVSSAPYGPSGRHSLSYGPPDSILRS